ncbi:MAG: hypothetical protein WAK93_02070 [Solirubrobacteraceae bacterium]
MRRLVRLLALVCALTTLTVAAVAVPSATATNDPAITDCSTNGRLTHTYTLAELRHARATLPSSIKEYTNCYDVLSQAMVAALKTGTYTGGSGKSSGGSFLPTPVIVILVILILAAVTFGTLAIRRRQGGPAAAGLPGSGRPGPAAEPPSGSGGGDPSSAPAEAQDQDPGGAPPAQ